MGNLVPTSRNLLITGIPRSGTSYLCAILNKVKNAVVINEPLEVIQIMRNSSSIPLSQYYAVVRERILKNEPISNKIVNGKFIEDTNLVDTRSLYIPEVDTDDFMLGTKNTLIYLNTLDRLEKEFPDATIIVCVRHPYDTIASWANVTFPHLKNADPMFLLNYVDEKSKREINSILQLKDLADRYAMWWDYLARIIAKRAAQVTVVRYEDMVANPKATIDAIFEKIPFPVIMRQALEASTPRSHRAKLGPHIIAKINKFCGKTANIMNYDIGSEVTPKK